MKSVQLKLNITHVFLVIIDVISSTILLLLSLLLGPVLALRGCLSLSKGFYYLWVFLPKGLCTSAIRAFIDWRMGNFQSCIAQVESIIAVVAEGRNTDTRNADSNVSATSRADGEEGDNKTAREAKEANGQDGYEDLDNIESARSKFKIRDLFSSGRMDFSPPEIAVLEDLFVTLTRAYFHVGRVDEAMQTILKAHKTLGIYKLKNLHDLDPKTAHLVRAGLAAGKLLEGSNVATVFVKSTPPAQKQTRPTRNRGRKNPSNISGPLRSGSDSSGDTKGPLGGGKASGKGAGEDRGKKSRDAKIIPFPTPTH